MATQELIPVVSAVIGTKTVQTVDGRALHTFLEVQTEFGKWVDRRIEEYDFIDEQDFSSFLAKSTGGRPTKEYALTLDMAKELAMVERNAKGKQARQYFIECERRLMESAPASEQPAKLSPSERERLMIAREAYKTARLFGFNDNMAILSADNYVRNTLGGGVLTHMGATHLLADPRGQVYTPTGLGQMMDPPRSAIAVNKMICTADLQVYECGGWLPTDKAADLYEWADTGKRHSNGTPVKQLRWFKSVLNHPAMVAQMAPTLRVVA